MLMLPTPALINMWHISFKELFGILFILDPIFIKSWGEKKKWKNDIFQGSQALPKAVKV